MSGSATVPLAVGCEVGFDGRVWRVVEWDGPNVVLRDGSTNVRQVEVGHLLARGALSLPSGPRPEELDPVGPVLDGLTPVQRAELEARIAHVLEVLTGYRRGDGALALPGEPREPFAPGTGRLARYRAKAAELGVSPMTVRRMAARFAEAGPAGLVDRRWTRGGDLLGGVDPRWLATAHTVLAEHSEASTPTRQLVLERIAARLSAEHGVDAVPLPGRTKALALLREITRGAGAFGGTKGKRQIAARPPTPYGSLRATRPGEYLLLDTTPLDVFAMEPVTLRWVNCELTVAMDLYDRCICALRLTPVSTKAVDAAAVLFEAVCPLPAPAAGWVEVRAPYHGLPQQVIVDAARLVDGEGRPLLPSVAAETIVVDHGKIFLSEHLMSVCQRLGISIQPARPFQGTDKAVIERFFRTLREQLLVALPGYKGPDVYHRGRDVEGHSYYFMHELEAIIRQWVAVYHRTAHEGLCAVQAPGLDLSPAEMFAHGVARAGFLQVPARADLVFDFLQVRWRTIQHYGVQIAGLRYDGPALGPYRDRTSPYAGRWQGKWPIRVDPGDVSRVYFHDPADGRWHVLAWEHADEIAGPFSDEAVAYARVLASNATGSRHVDARAALAKLLEAWDAGLTRNPAELRMALRQSERRLALVGPVTVLTHGPAPLVSADDMAREPVCDGDDDGEQELAACFPGEQDGAGEDFYADAMDSL